MPGNEKREGQRVPVALRIKLRFRKVDTFVSKFATNISTRGMFISSRKPKAPGTQLRFELRLADDSTVIAGRGVVTWTREFDAKRPKEPHGMGIAFVGLSDDSKELIARMVALRIEKGLGDEGIPYAVDANENSSETILGPAAGLNVGNVLKQSVDMRKALKRARSLAGRGELDAELAQLSRVSAAPVAESVDVASNELARLLGGSAIVTKHEAADPPTDHSGLADEDREDAAAEAAPKALLEVDDSAAEAEPEALPELEDSVDEELPQLEDVAELPTEALAEIEDEVAQTQPEDAAEPTEGLPELEDSVDEALPPREDATELPTEVLPELEDEVAQASAAFAEKLEDERPVEDEQEPAAPAEALPQLEDSVDRALPELEAPAVSEGDTAALQEQRPPAAEATEVGTDPLSLALDALDEGSADRELDELSVDVAGDEGSQGFTEAEAIAPDDPAFLMDEEPTRVGASLEIFAAYEAEESAAVSAISNQAPYGRAQTEVQDPDSYGELVAEQEFAEVTARGTDVHRSGGEAAAPPLEDVLGALESETPSKRAETEDVAPPLEDVLGALESETPSKRAETEDVDELDVLEDIEVGADETTLGTSEFEVLEEERAPSAGLDETLASFGEPDGEDDIDIDFS